MPVNKFFMALMPVSHVISWWCVLYTKEDVDQFSNAVAGIATFYCAWALYNIGVGGNTKEKGHVSMGLLAVSAKFLTMDYRVLFANMLVILNFAVVLPFFLNRGVTGVVKMIQKDVNSLTMVWGYTFLVYLVGNMVLWSYTISIFHGFVVQREESLAAAAAVLASEGV